MRKKKQAFPGVSGVFYGLLAILLLAGSLPGRAQPPTTPEKLAETWIGALNRHDTAAIARLYADSAQVLSPNWEGTKTGKEAVKEIYRYFASTPDLDHRMTHLIATDTALVIEYTTHGTFLHPESGTPDYMKGKKYELQNCTRLTITRGKILRQVNYFDQVAFLRQVGFFDQK